MSWLSGWSYRKQVTVTNGVASYQTKILVGESSGATGEEVDCGGKCLSTFNDLRFTGSDGTTLLDYWVESITGTTPNQLATVWVENDGTPSTTCYMYYGKADASAQYATPLLAGEATFPFFDDFSGTFPGTKWAGDTANGSVSGGILTFVSTAGVWKVIYTAAQSGDIALRTRTNLANGDYTQVFLAKSDLSGSVNVYHISAATNHSRAATFDGTEQVISNTALGFGSYHLYDLCRVTTGTDTVRVFMDGGQLGSDTTAHVSAVDMGALLRIGNAFNILCDWILIRKYALTEPTWGSWGSEEALLPFRNYYLSLLAH